MSNLIQACRMQYPETIPVDIGILPAAWLKYGEELQRLVDDYPQFFGGMKKDLSKIIENLPASYHKGTYIDEWNCVWSNLHDGNEAIVTGHPVTCEEDVYSLQIPSNRNGRLPHGFMYLRLLDLCGFEDAMIYFAEEDKTIGKAIIVWICLLMDILSVNNISRSLNRFADSEIKKKDMPNIILVYFFLSV